MTVHLQLILLGVLVALGSSSGGSAARGGGINFDRGARDLDFDMPEWDFRDFRDDLVVPTLAIAGVLREVPTGN